MKYSNTRALIAGHTDSQGSAASNLGRSYRRAESAATYILAQGVARARTSTEGRGETEPIATNDSDAGRNQNRRVEVAIYTNSATGGKSGT